MRKQIQTLILAIGLFIGGVPNLQAAEKPAKLGVVNVALLLEKSPQAIAASQKLKQEFMPQQKALQKLAMDLNKKQSEYNKNKLVMTDAQKQAKERELALLSREIQRKKNDIQELLNLRRNEELAQIQKLVNEAIKKVGEKEHFDLILYEGIAYTNNRLDITQKVLAYLAKLNKQKQTEFNK